MNLQVVLERETDGVAHQRRADRDLDLLDALRRREPMAAECLVTRYGERAYRLARRITGNGQDAEEVVQDAFWTVVRKIDTFRGESAFGSWLYRIVANVAYQARSFRSRCTRSHDASTGSESPSASSTWRSCGIWRGGSAAGRDDLEDEQPVARRSRSCGNTRQGGNDDEVQPHSRRDGVVGGADSATRDGSPSSSLSASASRAGGAASVRSMAFCSPLSVASARATTVMKRAWISGRIGALGLIRRAASPWPFNAGRPVQHPEAHHCGRA